MAITIKNIPVLKGHVAKSFIDKATSSFEKKGTVDFSVQVKSANKILEKSNL